ncbi:hypothetical protein AAK943_15890 [Emergencia timonensis]|uniref:hypothetical protein n=1 Tax=Emergencia timonensis TaxID=1776384 RepID=UPI00266BD713|nr:hypothetical protein [Emergencia timonensis]
MTGGETHVNLVFKIEVAGTTPLWEPTGDDHREQQSRRTLQAGMSRRVGLWRISMTLSARCLSITALAGVLSENLIVCTLF